MSRRQGPADRGGAPGAPARQPAPAGAGRVVLVATPIGNLDDLSPRAVKALAGADLICCEDTRHTRKLLTHAGVHGVPLVALHQHNEAATAAGLVARAARGETVAVVTDAGMPGISDPGQRLVQAAAAEGVEVTVVPGPSAVVAALAVSGLPAERFCFEGFLPAKGPQRHARLTAIATSDRSVVFYEAPHRVARTLDDLERHCGPERQLAVARELTKVHEEVWRGTVDAARRWVAASPPRGEWALVVGPRVQSVAGDDELRAALHERVSAGDDRRTAVAAVASALGVPKRRVYQLALELAAAPRSPHLS